ncbi:SGNH hydrolase-type esterase domain-containing protein [Chaetomidium leptoderma]|uniref:SGNH hydrolase-type esterase domain-containing protein n=1 Tax=Chaetomidium leptoderma TaxID=669021 RepID=A0AAN6VU37_9PEZI|nr:SGNH hydrolase-type esterase domain-containing protein [Chaetomidium leptoderma]
MLSLPTLLLAGLAASGVHGTPVEVARRATPTVYLAGDSTMAKTSGALMGWGEYLARYINIPVVNKAISGRSARSYTNEGRFTEIERVLQRDDIVVIEFGHNDGGSPNSASDNGRSDCPGTGNEVCKSGKTGETVYTFNRYVETAARSFVAKGARVIVSSQTPNNLFEGGAFIPGAPRFVGYAAQAARNVGNGGASFVDHFQAVANMFLKLGSAKTNALFPNDHTHTSPAGADLVAQAFVQAISRDFNGTTPLKGFLKSPVPKVPFIVGFPPNLRLVGSLNRVGNTTTTMASRGLVLITGINGYVAAHTAASFLKAGYAARGTVRTRTANVESLVHTLGQYHEGNRLELVEVPDISVDGAFDRAVEAHLASPVSMTETDPAPMMRAAVQGTTSLLNSALTESKRESQRGALKSVVFMSTISAVFSPSRPAGHVFTEADWNDVAEEEVRRLGKDTPGYVIYQASKTAAERAFWRFGTKKGASFGMTALCPAPVLGPPLYLPEPISSLSMRVKDIYDMFHGGPIPEFSPVRSTFIDVRDVAELVLRAVEKDCEAEGGRERYLLVGQFDASKAGALLGRDRTGFQKSVVDSAEVFVDAEAA